MATVLVVDDDTAIAQMLADLVTEEGHTALSAPNGEVALHLARLHRPALIITDVMMPLMDGYTLLQHIRTDAELMYIPVVFISAVWNQYSLSQTPAPPYAYLPKPLDLNLIERLLRTLPAA